jgi:hypothetical protein
LAFNVVVIYGVDVGPAEPKSKVKALFASTVTELTFHVALLTPMFNVAPPRTTIAELDARSETDSVPLLTIVGPV